MKKVSKIRIPPQIGMAALTDIIFMLLFFFMVVTVLRKTLLKVEITLPMVSEAKKLNHNSLINHIDVGKPKAAVQGERTRIQINDAFVDLKDIPYAVRTLDRSRPENLLPKVTTALIVDKDVKMGLVGDIKTKLRKANKLKISYTALQE